MRYVALLRGVNLAGPSTRVAMADLRRVFEGLGFDDVDTLLNSGNVVFTAPGNRAAVLARIQDGLATQLRLKCLVTLLSASEVAAAVRDNPLAKVATNASRLLVVVPFTSADFRRLQSLLGRSWHPEALALGRNVAYLWCPNGVASSALWMAVDRALERSGTARNLATMTRLEELLKTSTPKTPKS